MHDPGMDVKMNRQSLADFDVWLDGGTGNEAWVKDLIDFVDRRWDCADFRVLSLLKLQLAANQMRTQGRAPGGQRSLWNEIRRCLLGFRYWMDEPGEDSMCFWSENHQVIFFTCAYLAGQAFPDETFTNSLLTGSELHATAARRLNRWFTGRFRFGYTEWNSTTYYDEDAAALALLVDYAADPSIARRAAICLDLLFLDMALVHFQGRLVASSGRAYEAQTKYPETQDVAQLLRWAFGSHDEPFRLDHMSAAVVTSNYRVPPAIRAIAGATDSLTIHTSFGLDVSEIAHQCGEDLIDQGLQAWLQEAFTTPETIETTMELLERFSLDSNTFLNPLQKFRPLKSTGLLPHLVRAVNPATQGVAIQRADVTTFRSPSVQLSCATRHHPGSFGDQQLIWMAGLPGDVAVYATNPAQPMFDSIERGFSPSAWVGNGILPDVAQHEHILLANYDTTVRRGYLESKRHHASHIFWPASRMEESIYEPTLLIGRHGQGHLAVITSHPLHVESPESYIQDGKVTAMAVVAGRDESFDEFCATVRAATLELHRKQLRLHISGHSYLLAPGKPLRIDGAAIPVPNLRYDTPWVRAPRFPDEIRVCCDGHQLVLRDCDATREIR